MDGIYDELPYIYDISQPIPRHSSPISPIDHYCPTLCPPFNLPFALQQDLGSDELPNQGCAGLEEPQNESTTDSLNTQDQSDSENNSISGSDESPKQVLSRDHFMAIASLAALRSKDPRTCIGACIVDTNDKVVGIGYNSMPYIHNDDVTSKDEVKRNNDEIFKEWGKEEKKPYVIHAAVNAIINRTIPDLTGCTIYLTQCPDEDCAHLIGQSGIKRVKYWHPFKMKGTRDHEKIAMKIFMLANVSDIDKYEPEKEVKLTASNRAKNDKGEKMDLFDQSKGLTLTERLYKRESNAKYKIKEQLRITWEEFFIGLAQLECLFGNKVGACIVNHDSKQVLAVGGSTAAPSGKNHTTKEWLNDIMPSHDSSLDTNDPYTQHAEYMAIASYKGIKPLKGCTLYVTKAPCVQCAKLIVQTGIKEVKLCQSTASVNEGRRLQMKVNKLTEIIQNLQMEFENYMDMVEELLLIHSVEENSLPKFMQNAKEFPELVIQQQLENSKVDKYLKEIDQLNNERLDTVQKQMQEKVEEDDTMIREQEMKIKEHSTTMVQQLLHDISEEVQKQMEREKNMIEKLPSLKYLEITNLFSQMQDFLRDNLPTDDIKLSEKVEQQLLQMLKGQKLIQMQVKEYTAEMIKHADKRTKLSQKLAQQQMQKELEECTKRIQQLLLENLSNKVEQLLEHIKINIKLHLAEVIYRQQIKTEVNVLTGKVSEVVQTLLMENVKKHSIKKAKQLVNEKTNTTQQLIKEYETAKQHKIELKEDVEQLQTELLVAIEEHVFVIVYAQHVLEIEDIKKSLKYWQETQREKLQKVQDKQIEVEKLLKLVQKLLLNKCEEIFEKCNIIIEKVQTDLKLELEDINKGKTERIPTIKLINNVIATKCTTNNGEQGTGSTYCWKAKKLLEGKADTDNKDVFITSITISADENSKIGEGDITITAKKSKFKIEKDSGIGYYEEHYHKYKVNLSDKVIEIKSELIEQLNNGSINIQVVFRLQKSS